MSMDVVQSGGDPQVGNLSTPINGSAFTKTFINALPAYRQGLSPNRRGLEVGMAHGYLLYGPFALLGPLRDTEFAATAGLLATIGLVSILTICLSIYGAVGASKPTETLTTPNVPEDLATKEGWSEFASGFLLGACGGAFFAFFLCQTPHLEPLVKFASGIWSS
jgi:photosystem I subunit 11